ncbi:protein of unknown function [Rhodovastum atsumiense]|nr:protein of unknown function [Rhodovastum atsumiense]
MPRVQIRMRRRASHQIRRIFAMICRIFSESGVFQPATSEFTNTMKYDYKIHPILIWIGSNIYLLCVIFK